MKDCSQCKYAALCLSGDFKNRVVRCTVCGHFRLYDPEPAKYVDIDVPACLRIPKLPRNRCHFCAGGSHMRVIPVWNCHRPDATWWSFGTEQRPFTIKQAMNITQTYGYTSVQYRDSSLYSVHE